MGFLRNAKETPSTQNLGVLRNFQYWPKFFFPHKNTCVFVQTLEKFKKTLFSNVHEGTGREREDYHGTLKETRENLQVLII